MLWIKYKVLGYQNVTDENGDIVQQEAFCEVSTPYSDEALTAAENTAYNGEYTIEDDGQPDTAQPTNEERIAELEEALYMLLNGVTE